VEESFVVGSAMRHAVDHGAGQGFAVDLLVAPGNPTHR